MLLPAILLENHKPLFGWYVLAWGWWGILSLDIAWFANSAFLFSIISFCNKDYTAAKITSIIAILLGSTSFLAKEWWFNEGSGTKITGLGIAFYVWMLSFFMMLITNIIFSKFKNKSN